MSIDLSFKSPGHRFNVRAAAIIQYEGYVLCDQERGTNFSFLPGGRIQRGESSAAALVRELAEELEIDVQVKAPVIITQSFFDGIRNERYHELGFYYAIERPEDLAFTPGEICRSIMEDGNWFDFSWVKATPEELIKAQVEPVALHHHFIDLPAHPVHVIINE